MKGGGRSRLNATMTLFEPKQFGDAPLCWRSGTIDVGVTHIHQLHACMFFLTVASNYVDCGFWTLLRANY